MKQASDLLTFLAAIAISLTAYYFATKPDAFDKFRAAQNNRSNHGTGALEEKSIAGLAHNHGANLAGNKSEAQLQVENELKISPPFKLVLPTDNREIFNDPKDFYMHTNRYKDGVNLRPWQGGKYGFVRTPLTTNHGVLHTKLHEGIDIKPINLDSSGKPLDEVRTISDGQVVYINPSSSRSNYGKYIVVRHDWPDGEFYSLYAHLATTEVTNKQEVNAGDTLGIMGYTGAGITKDRAHVHVELAFMMTDRYNSGYSPRNGHYNYNGLNLVGMDIGRLLRRYQESPHFSIRDFLDEEEPYFTVRTKTSRKPGILKRHPWLGVDLADVDSPKSWEITFARSGVPMQIRPVEKPQRYASVTWVKDVPTNHSYMTAGRLLGTGKNAKLSSRGHRHITLISEAF